MWSYFLHHVHIKKVAEVKRSFEKKGVSPEFHGTTLCFVTMAKKKLSGPDHLCAQAD